MDRKARTGRGAGGTCLRVFLALLLVQLLCTQVAFGGTTEVENVTDYGAVAGDGNDDLAAFEAARNALPPAGGVVYVPCGVFHLSATFAVEVSNVALAGNGSCSEIQPLTAGMTLIRMGFVQNNDPAPAVSGAVVRDLRLRDPAPGANAPITGIHFINAVGSNVRNMVGKSLGTAVHIECDDGWCDSGTLQDTHVEESRFVDCGRGGAAYCVISEAWRSRVAELTMRGNNATGGGLLYQKLRSSEIAHNTIQGFDRECIAAGETADLSNVHHNRCLETASAGTWVIDTVFDHGGRVDDNYLECGGPSGGQVGGIRTGTGLFRGTAHGNKVRHCGGIGMEIGHGYTSQGSTFNAIGGPGIVVTGYNVSITVQLRRIDGPCIELRNGAHDTNLAGSQLRRCDNDNSGDPAVLVDGTASINATGNTIEDPAPSSATSSGFRFTGNAGGARSGLNGNNFTGLAAGEAPIDLSGLTGSPALLVCVGNYAGGGSVIDCDCSTQSCPNPPANAVETGNFP